MITLLRRLLGRGDKHPPGTCRECSTALDCEVTMEPITFREEEWGWKGANFLCQQCYDELTIGEVTAHFREWWDEYCPYPSRSAAVQTFRENVEQDKTTQTES